MLSLGVLVSGTGTNLQSIQEAIAARHLNATIRLVISNKPDAPALERARRASIPTLCLSHRDYPTRDAFDAALVEGFRQASVDWIVLAGFMRILTRTMLDAFPSRILNIHPSLLPAFPGVEAQAQALEYGVKLAGCTVHLVDEGTDTGPIIAQRAVPVFDTDDTATLRDRILEQEHSLLVGVLKDLSEGRIEIIRESGSRARVRTRTA